jgi:hypothetical protein
LVREHLKGYGSRLDALNVSEMASGHLSLDISREVDWEEFPEFVRELMTLCRGTEVNRGDAGDTRVWRVTIEGVDMWVAWEEQDWGEQGPLVSLASMNSEGDRIVVKLYETLKEGS